MRAHASLLRGPALIDPGSANEGRRLEERPYTNTTAKRMRGAARGAVGGCCWPSVPGFSGGGVHRVYVVADAAPGYEHTRTTPQKKVRSNSGRFSFLLHHSLEEEPSTYFCPLSQLLAAAPVTNKLLLLRSWLVLGYREMQRASTQLNLDLRPIGSKRIQPNRVDSNPIESNRLLNAQSE